MDSLLRSLDQYKDYYVPFMPLIVAAAAWWLGVVSARFKKNDEQRQRLRQVLFYLIELRKQLENSNIEKLTALLSDVVAGVVGAEVHAAQRELLHRNLFELAKQQLSSQLPELDERERRFQEAVATLAAYEPWLAYRLNGKHAILRNLTVLEQWLQGIELESEPDEQERLQVNALVRRTVLNIGVADLERLILDVAWGISLKQFAFMKWKLRTLNDYRETKRQLERLFAEIKREFEQEQPMVEQKHLVVVKETVP